MKLIRLELLGFKSFRDKTIVNFNQPITAIVGSNGCGKSNVVDAMFWVMGDMSPKHLRGQSMTDVIFSGSRDSQPMDMAEVSLVMGREEGDPELPAHLQGHQEIQITRRYYRSGDSEYFMNKAPCRLRDIQEFFMDTGLGAKAYSIIEQGYITRMVTQKPEERRMVIEEVAGVMKFKARRQETLRKIEATQGNLQRVDDIVGDLQKQLSSLKKQAEKADKHKEYSALLKEFEIYSAGREFLNRRSQNSELDRRLSELRHAFEQKTGDSDRQRESLQELEEKIQFAQSEVDAKRALYREAELALKDLESEIQSRQMRIHTLEERHTRDISLQGELRIRQDVITQNITTKRESKAALDLRANELRTLVENAERDVAQKRMDLETQEAELRRIRGEVHERELEFTRLTQNLQNLQRQHADAHNKKSDFQQRLQGLEIEIDDKDRQRQNTFGTLQAAFSSRQDLESELSQIQAQLQEHEGQLDEKTTARDELRQELHGSQVKLEHLEQLQNSFEGLNASAKTLALHRKNLGFEKIILADHVRVPQYLERASEALLGSHLERLVIGSNELSSFQDLVREQPKGNRVPAWVPTLTSQITDPDSDGRGLDRLCTVESNESYSVDGHEVFVTKSKVKSAREVLTDLNETVGYLPELISADPSTADANRNSQNPWMRFFADTWVVRDASCFSLIARLFSGDLPCHVVSLQGDIMRQDGTVELVTGPFQSAEIFETHRADEPHGLMQRQREIETLREHVNDLEEKLLIAETAHELCVKNLRDTKIRFQELSARLAAINPDVERHTLFLGQVEASLARLHEKRDIYRADLEKLSLDLQTQSTAIEELTLRMEQFHGEREVLNQRMSQIQSAYELEKERLKDRDTALSDLNRQSKELDRQTQELQTQLAALEQEHMMSTERLGQIEAELVTMSEELQKLAAENDTLKIKIESQRELCGSAQSELQRQIENLDQLRISGKEIQKVVDAIAAELTSLVSEIKDLEQNVAVNDVELKNLNSRILEQYQLPLSEMSEAQLQEMSSPRDIEDFANPEAVNERIQDLKRKIERLGKINMVAAEEFSDLSKRHEFLFIQRQDIRDSLSQLKTALERINEESIQRFTEAFHAVNASFQQTFPTLFGGGHAELILTNPDDMLETGVDIVAQPPGKKLQSITLLSGGEKALTAVSLVFGIYNIKPSPFAVLDEVDAPLDDSNVGRFNHQIRIMSEKSQIILITHKKKSMESSDALFGVTMETPGVSKVASARLGDLKTDAAGLPARS